jgi:hypothetical protein
LAAPAVLAVAALVAAAPRALAVPALELLALAHRPGSEALVVAELLLPELAVLSQLPGAAARSAAVVELLSRPSSSAATARTSASRATGPR